MEKIFSKHVPEASKERILEKGKKKNPGKYSENSVFRKNSGNNLSGNNERFMNYSQQNLKIIFNRKRSLENNAENFFRDSASGNIILCTKNVVMPV